MRRGSARPQTEYITEFSLGGDGGERERGGGAAAGPRERRPASGGDAGDRAARAQQCA